MQNDSETAYTSGLVQTLLEKFPKLFQNFSKAKEPNSKTMKLVFIWILKPHENRKLLFFDNIFYNFWWVMLCIINSKMNKHNTYDVYYDRKLHPFQDIYRIFQIKIQNFSIAVLKILSFLTLSRSWKMAFSSSITPQNFRKPVQTLHT